jgi:subtilisin family serine protease
MQKISLIEILKKGKIEIGESSFFPKVEIDENYLIVHLSDQKRKFITFISKIGFPLTEESRHIRFVDSKGEIKDFYITDEIEEIEKFLKEYSNRDKEEVEYIVEFKDEPAAIKKAELIKQSTIKEKIHGVILDENLKQRLTGSERAEYEKIEKEIAEYEKYLRREREKAKAEISKILKKYGIREGVKEEFKNIFNGAVIKATKAAKSEIEKLPSVKKVYENREVKLFLSESVPLINASKLWSFLDKDGKNITGKNIKIAIVDTGVDYTHPDLGKCFGSGCKVIGGWDFVNNDPDPMDDHGHGTHVAGIAAANGALKGVAPDANILAYKVLDSEGYGKEDWIIAGIERAVNDGANVISMSLGINYYYFENCYDVALSKVVDNAVDAGVVVVVAAGNEGPDYQTISAPGCAKKVITVGAVNKSDNIAKFSSRGPHVSKYGVIPKPDVVAPGVGINSTVPTGICDFCTLSGYISMSGTSMATPHVSGLAALLLQVFPSWKPEEIKSSIMLGAIDLGYDSATQGSGRIDAIGSYNTSILTFPQSIGILVKNGVDNSTFKIKNLRNYTLSISLRVSNASDVKGNLYNISLLNASDVILPANSEVDILFSTNLTELSGIFFGKIILTTEGRNYTIPYAVAKLTELNVTVFGDELKLYPNICLHDDEGKFATCKSQGWDFVGNNYSFLVPPERNYTAYAYSSSLDWKNSSLTYILMNRSEVTQPSIILLNLSNAREFNVRAKSLSNIDLKLYEWHWGFVSYLNATELLLDVRVWDETGVVGDRTIYISNKPEGPVNTDVILKYTGVPVRR